MQNYHGRTVLDFLIDYWTLSKSMHKLGPTSKRQIFHMVLNNIGEYIQLLIKRVLNARALSCMEVHVHLTKMDDATVNDVKLLRSVKPNSCGFSQLCTSTINSVYFRVDS